MSEPASISSSIAVRYAKAVFEIAKEDGKLADLETSINDLSAALEDSTDLQLLINSPLYCCLCDNLNKAQLGTHHFGLVPCGATRVRS